MTSDLSKPSANPSRPPAAVSLAAFTSSVDRFGISPLLVIIAVDFGASISVAVVVASIYFFTYGLSQPVWGMLSDRFGRLAIMRFALIGALACAIASAFAPNLALLTAARAFTGAFFGAIVPAAITYVGDTSEEHNRQSMMSDLMAAVAVGTALATAAAGILGQALSWRVVFAISAVLALVALLPLFRLAEPRRSASLSIGVSLRLFFREKWALIVTGLAFIEGSLVLGILTLLAPALEFQGVKTSWAGLSVAAYGVATLLFTRLVRPLSAHLSRPRIVFIGGSCLTVGLGVVALHLSVATVVLAALLLGASWALMHTSLQAWATQVVPAARGMSVAFFAGALFAGSAASSALAGTLAEEDRWTLIFGVSSATALALTFVAVFSMTQYLSSRRA